MIFAGVGEKSSSNWPAVSEGTNARARGAWRHPRGGRDDQHSPAIPPTALHNRGRGCAVHPARGMAIMRSSLLLRLRRPPGEHAGQVPDQGRPVAQARVGVVKTGAKYCSNVVNEGVSSMSRLPCLGALSSCENRDKSPRIRKEANVSFCSDCRPQQRET